MRLLKRLEINQEPVLIQSEQLILEKNAVSRAYFITNQARQGFARYSTGYQSLSTMFEGIVLESAREKGKVKLWCEGLSHVLNKEISVFLRHTRPQDIFDLIRQETGFHFWIPDRPYAHKMIPYFYARTSAKNVLSRMFAAFGVKNGLWEQLTGGKIFWGDWGDSRFARTQPMEGVEPLLQSVDVISRTIRVPVIPGLFPGARFMMDGETRTVERVTIQDSFTRVQY